MKHFISQSIIYPFWWRNIGTGHPRNLWLNFLWFTVGGGGLLKNRKNLIYTIYWKLKSKIV